MEKSGRQKVLPASVRRGTTTFARRSPLPTGTRLPGYRFSKSARKARCTPAHNPVSEGPPPRDRQRQDSRRAVPGPGQPLPHVRPRQFRRAGSHKPGKTGPNRDRDSKYAVISTSKGQESALRCKACNAKGAIRSNAAIAVVRCYPLTPRFTTSATAQHAYRRPTAPPNNTWRNCPKAEVSDFDCQKCTVSGCH